MEANKLQTARTKQNLVKQLGRLINHKTPELGSIFRLGFVVRNIDPENSNRLKIRIPVLDDGYFYKENSNERDNGIDKLPWCIPNNKYFVQTPEVNSVVLVGVFDTVDPLIGRIWFDCFLGLTTKDLFNTETLTPSLTDTEAWQNTEDSLQREFDATPGLRKNQAITGEKRNTEDVRVGIRGKGKNKIVLDKTTTEIVQNDGEKTQTKIQLDENINILTSNETNILSDKSSARENPVFASYVHDYHEDLHKLLKQIITILSTKPGISSSPGSPVSPSPESGVLSSLLNQVKQKHNRLKNQGTSKYLTIN